MSVWVGMNLFALLTYKSGWIQNICASLCGGGALVWG